MITLNEYQERVWEWMHKCFPHTVITNKEERAMRFLEEALELCQSLGLNKKMANKLVDYTFSRPEGDPENEVGGVMITLAALCGTAGVDLEIAAKKELDRVNRPEILKKIQGKQVTKQLMGITPEELVVDHGICACGACQKRGVIDYTGFGYWVCQEHYNRFCDINK